MLLQNKKLIYKDGLNSIIAFAVGTLLVLLLQVFVIRYTSTKEYGEFVYLFAIANILNIIFTARSGEIALQLIGKEWIKKDISKIKAFYIGLSFLELKINILAFIIASLIVLIFLVDKINYIYFLLIFLSLPLQSGYGVAKAVIISSADIKAKSYFEIKYGVLKFIFGIILTYLFHIIGFIISIVLSELVKNILARRLANSFVDNLKHDNRNENLKKINFSIKEGFDINILGKNLFIQGINQIDIILLGIFRSAHEVAIYKVAKSIVLIPAQLFAPIWTIVKPRLLKSYHENDIQRLFKLILYPSILMIIVSIVVYIILYLFNMFDFNIFGYVYGNAYIESQIIFKYLFLGVFLYSAGYGWINYFFIISAKQKEAKYLFAILFICLAGVIYMFKDVALEQLSLYISLVFIGGVIMFYGYIVKNYKGKENVKS